MMTLPKPTITVEEIGPELAAHYLSKNMTNRPKSRVRIAEMARDMIEGDWLVTHAGIAFDWDDELIDGQNRLEAIIKSDTTQLMAVARGLDPDARHVIDTGRPRSASDSLALLEMPDTTVLASMAKLVILWDQGALKLSVQAVPRVTNHEVVQWVLATPEADTFRRAARRIYAAGFPTPSVGTLAAALMIVARINSEDCEDLIERMTNRTLLGAKDPLFTLSRRIEAAARSRETLRSPGLLALYFRTWNALRRGLPLTNLRIGFNNGSVISIPKPE